MIDMTRQETRATITLDRAILARIKAAIHEGRASSVSAYVDHAVASQLDTEPGFDATIAEMLADSGGPPTDEERAEVQRLLSTDAA